MKLSFALFLAALPFVQLAMSDPLQDATSTEAPQVSNLAIRYMYNVGSDKDHELDNEKIAWDDANALATSAKRYSTGGTWEPILDYYFGTQWCGQDFAQTEIKTALTNAVNVHDPGTPIFRSRMFIYLHETGDYDPPYYGESHCGNGTYAYSLVFEGNIWNDYYVVFCDLFWNRTLQQEPVNGSEPLRSLTSMKTEVLAKKNGGNDQTENATLLYATTGHVYLHELHHFQSLVSARQEGTNDLAYGASYVHGLANLFGCRPGDSFNAVSSLNNADTFATFSDAAYWSEQFQKASQDFPKWNITADPPGAATVSTFSAPAPAISANGTIPSGLPADPNNSNGPAPADATVTMSASNSSASAPPSSSSAAPSSTPSCAPAGAPQADVQAAIQALSGQICGGAEASCSQASTSGMATIEACGGSTDLCISASAVAGYANSISNACNNNNGQIGGSQAVNEAQGLNVTISFGNDT